MSVSNVIMYILPIFVTPILSRLYGPEFFGEWGVFSSIISIVTIGFLGGLENVIMIVEEKNIINILFLCLLFGTLSILLLSLLFIFVPLVKNYVVTIYGFVDLFVIYSILYALYLISFNIVNRYELYNKLALCSIIFGVAQAFFRIFFGIAHPLKLNGLIIGTIIAQCCVTIYLFYQSNKVLKFCVKRRLYISLHSIISLLGRYKKFPMYDAPSNTLSFAAFNLPIIFLSMYFDKNSIGCYSIILQLLLMPMSLIGSAIGKVYYQQLCKNDSDQTFLQTLTKSIVGVLSVVAIIPMFFIVCGGDKIVVFFLGNDWKTAGSIALCLSLWSFPTILTQPLLPLFRVTNTQNTLFLYNVTYFICSIGCILLGCMITTNLLVILVFYSSICFIVKISLFIKILSLSQVNVKICSRFLSLWLIVFSIFILRLVYL